MRNQKLNQKKRKKNKRWRQAQPKYSPGMMCSPTWRWGHKRWERVIRIGYMLAQLGIQMSVSPASSTSFVEEREWAWRQCLERLSIFRHYFLRILKETSVSSIAQVLSSRPLQIRRPKCTVVVCYLSIQLSSICIQCPWLQEEFRKKLWSTTTRLSCHHVTQKATTQTLSWLSSLSVRAGWPAAVTQIYHRQLDKS